MDLAGIGNTRETSKAVKNTHVCTVGDIPNTPKKVIKDNLDRFYAIRRDVPQGRAMQRQAEGHKQFGLHCGISTFIYFVQCSLQGV